MTSWLKLRPFNTSCVICLPVMVNEISGDSVCTAPMSMPLTPHLGCCSPNRELRVYSLFARHAEDDAGDLKLLESDGCDLQVVSTCFKSGN